MKLKLAYMALMVAALFVVGCGVVAQPALEISDRSTNDTVVGFFDYAIEVHCEVYNSGDKGGQAKVLATFKQDGTTYEERASGGVAAGDERKFSFTFEDAVLSLDAYQYNCQLE